MDINRYIYISESDDILKAAVRASSDSKIASLKIICACIIDSNNSVNI